jgi:hypothetical protein
MMDGLIVIIVALGFAAVLCIIAIILVFRN